MFDLSPYRGVLFDMDGTLIDSEEQWIEAEVAVFRALGLDVGPKDCVETIGMGIDKVVEYRFRKQAWDNERHSFQTVESDISRE